jgi:hypothetical protein
LNDPRGPRPPPPFPPGTTFHYVGHGRPVQIIPGPAPPAPPPPFDPNHDDGEIAYPSLDSDDEN